MIIYISVDAEGISGIYNLWQVMPGQPEFEFARRMMANDINAAARGAFEAGAERVIVNDGHNNGNNMIIDMLDERIELISGAIRPLGMAQGAELGADAAMLVGYHAARGTKGVISHSYAYGSVVEMRLNGRIIAEHDLIGNVIGAFGTPVIFLSGDDRVAQAARASIPNVYTVETKTCISDGAALCRHPKTVARDITETVKRAVVGFKKGEIAPMVPSCPVELDVRYVSETHAELASRVPGTVRVCGHTVGFRGDDYLSAYKMFMTGMPLAAGFRDAAALYL